MTKSAVAALEVKLSALRPIRDQIERDEAERLSLQPKILTLTQAQSATKRWFGIMEGSKRAIPDQTWLTNVSVEANANTGKLMKINGVTVNQARVGETMYRLSNQPEFYQRVDLRFTAVRDGEGENVEFELSAPLAEDKPAGAAAASTPGGGNATQVN
jgi:Tfp pilus assembly protein PilN